MSEVDLERKLARLDALDAMFQTEGWEYILTDLREEYDRLGLIENIPDGESLTKAKAIRESLYVLIHYPTICEHQRAQLDEAVKDEEDDDGA